MLRKKAFIIVIVIISYSCDFVNAQKTPVKYGKVSFDEIKMSVYEKDTSGSAVAIVNYGVAEISYGPEGFELIFTEHVRIKILKKLTLNLPNLF